MESIIIQDVLIQCDNPSCDYKIVNESKDPYVDTSKYVNMPCPKCGENLLTEQDYKDYKVILDAVKLAIELSKGVEVKQEDKKRLSFHAHDGVITIKEE